MDYCRFSFEDMLDLKGNTAVYMLYAHARIASIVRKAGKDVSHLAKSGRISLDDPREVSACSPSQSCQRTIFPVSDHCNTVDVVQVTLGMQIVRFPETLEDTLAEMAPNRITEYVYELSNIFNSFYTECKVI